MYGHLSKRARRERKKNKKKQTMKKDLFVAFLVIGLFIGLGCGAYFLWQEFNKTNVPLAFEGWNYVTSCTTCEKAGIVTTCNGRTFTDYCTGLGYVNERYACRWEGIHGQGYVIKEKITATAGAVFTAADGVNCDAEIGTTTTYPGQTTTTQAQTSTTQEPWIIPAPDENKWDVIIGLGAVFGFLVIMVLGVLVYRRMRN